MNIEQSTSFTSTENLKNQGQALQSIYHTKSVGKNSPTSPLSDNDSQSGSQVTSPASSVDGDLEERGLNCKLERSKSESELYNLKEYPNNRSRSQSEGCQKISGICLTDPDGQDLTKNTLETFLTPNGLVPSH